MLARPKPDPELAGAAQRVDIDHSGIYQSQVGPDRASSSVKTFLGTDPSAFVPLPRPGGARRTGVIENEFSPLWV